ncbi:MAG: transcriptional repressor LexA, partial [Planctomycetota bacterium]
MATYTAKQRQVLQFIRRSFEDLGIAPTLEEIAYELGGITRVAVLDHLRALERKGAIQRRARECRAIEILDPDYTPCRGLPLEGTIAAGEPIMAVEQREDITLEQYLGVDDGCFLLRVRGNSMVDDHIMDGDLVLGESSKSARDGETVGHDPEICKCPGRRDPWRRSWCNSADVSPRLPGLCLLVVCGACASAPREPLRPTGGLDSDLVWRADLHARRGEDREAEELYRKAIDEEPGSIRAHTGLQAIQKRRGRELAVRREYDSLDPDPFLMARLHPNPVLQMELYQISDEPYRSIGLGASAAELGKIAYAKEHFESAVEMDPGNPWARLTLGRMELAQGRLGSAEAQFRASLWTEPGHPTAAAGLSSVADRRGDLREAYRWALEAYERAPGREGPAHRLHDLCVRMEERKALLDGAAALSEGSDKAMLLASDLWERAGQPQIAAQAIARARERGATGAEVEALEREWKEPALRPFVVAFTNGVMGRYRHYAATGEAESFDEFVDWARGLFERTTGRELGRRGVVMDFSFVGKLMDATLGTDEPLVRACAEAGLLLVLGQREGGPPEAMLADVVRREPLRRVRVRGTEVEREAVWTG